jgi:hypothetical protein
MDFKPGMRVQWISNRNQWRVARNAVVLRVTAAQVQILFRDEQFGLQCRSVIGANLVYPRPLGSHGTAWLDSEADRLLGVQRADR